MRRGSKWLLTGAGGIVLGGAALFVAGFLLTRGDQTVPATVADDTSLPRFTVNGAVFHARTLGDPSNPVVVVVHGGPGADHRALLPLSPLSDRFFVVFYDQRSSGLSERRPPDELTIDVFLDDLDAIVDRFGGSVSLVGHSWGGLLAASYAARYPDKVERLVLAEPIPFTGALALEADIVYGPSFKWRLLVPGARAWFLSLHVDGPDDRAAADWLITNVAPHANPEHFCGGSPPNARPMLWRSGADALRHVVASLHGPDGRFRDDLVAGAARFSGDVLFIAGTCSRSLGSELQKRQMKAFPRAHLVVVPQAGHMMFLDNPESSVAAVRAHLEAGR